MRHEELTFVSGDPAYSVIAYIRVVFKNAQMIVIHIDNGTPDAAILSSIYKGLDNITLCYNRSKSNIKRILRITGDEPVMLLGHGTPQGLLNISQNGFAVGSEHIEWLRNRQVIGIFCYASDFADRYGLHGFFTSMFISNMEEALMLQKHKDATDELISFQQKLFCDRVHTLLADRTPLKQWPEILQSQADSDIPFVRFNYEALTYYA